MGLEDELAAEPVLVVDDEGLDAALAELDRGRKPGRSAADDEDGHADGLDGPGGFRPEARASTRGSSGRPSTGSTRTPGRTSSMQDFTGMPSARTRHWEHWPLAQKMPWAAPSLG